MFTVGSAASKRAGGVASEGNTVISLNTPSTSNGAMTTAQMYFSTEDADGSGVKVGLFYLTTTSTMSYKCRSSATVGAVVKGSAQASTVALTVAVGDYVGWHCDDGQMERDTSGGAGLLWVAGDQCTVGTEATYALIADDIASINGTCVAWTKITKVLGGNSGYITGCLGGSVSNITKVLGGAV